MPQLFVISTTKTWYRPSTAERNGLPPHCELPLRLANHVPVPPSLGAGSRRSAPQSAPPHCGSHAHVPLARHTPLRLQSLSVTHGQASCALITPGCPVVWLRPSMRA